MIESDVSATLAETTATEKSAVVMQRQSAENCAIPHPSLFLRVGVTEVSRNRRNCEGYSGAVH